MSTLRKSPALIALLLATALGTGTSAQLLTLPPGPVAPNSAVTGTVTNDTNAFISFQLGCEIRILQPTGEVVSPHTLFGQPCDIVFGIPVGGSQTVNFTAPSQPGSYLVVFISFGAGGSARAAAILDVTAADPGIPSLALYPSGINLPQTAHKVDFANPGMTTWEFANTGNANHVFPATALIEIFSPGGTVALSTLNQGGVLVPAGKVTQVTLPIGGLAPGPYDVRGSWIDPGSGQFEQPRSGIHRQGSRVNLHLPDGSDLFPGGGIQIVLSAVDYAILPAPEPMYFLAVGQQPGTTVLPDGTQVPLVMDNLVQASLNNGLFGTLAGNIGTIPNISPVPFFGFLGEASNIKLSHPNVPSVVGLKLRMAAAALQPASGMNGATQPEEIAYF